MTRTCGALALLSPVMVTLLCVAALGACVAPTTPRIDHAQATCLDLLRAVPGEHAWSILDCGDLGVLGYDEHTTRTYAVNPAGDAYLVDDACGWSPL